jgi:hypothetical protein
MAVGHAPLVTKLEPQKYRVKITLDGYADWTSEVAVEAGKPSTVVAQMEQRK